MFVMTMGSPKTTQDEKAYWKEWEHACHYVRNRACCSWEDGSCCGIQKDVCGNGLMEDGKTCDDGNMVNGDGCDSNCKVEEADPTPESDPEPEADPKLETDPEPETNPEPESDPEPETNPELPDSNTRGTDAEEDHEGGGGYGDPHLKTWTKEDYQFHGECDLILIKAV